MPMLMILVPLHFGSLSLVGVAVGDGKAYNFGKSVATRHDTYASSKIAYYRTTVQVQFPSR